MMMKNQSILDRSKYKDGLILFTPVIPIIQIGKQCNNKCII